MKKVIVIFMLFFSLQLRAYCPHYPQLYIPCKTTELNWKNIQWWMQYYEIENYEIVMSQIWLETNKLSSRYCRENNNLFGMKLAKKRQTTAIGDLSGMAYYKSWIDSIHDYKLWQQKYYTEKQDYYVFLQTRGYAEDPQYINKLERVKEQLSTI